MKNLLVFIFSIPSIFLAQDQLTFNDILKIKNQDVFLKTVIEKGYSEGNSDGEKTYYGKGLSKDKAEATDWAEYTSLTSEFYFEQSNLEYSRKYSKGKKDVEKNCVVYENVTMLSTQYRYIYQN